VFFCTLTLTKKDCLLRYFCYYELMNTVSRTISGVIAWGMGLLVVFGAIRNESNIWSLSWGVVVGVFLFGIGVYLFFHKKEDDIEKVKKSKK